MISANLVTTLEAASLLGISQPYLYNIIKAGRLTVVGKFGKNIVLSRPEVDRFKTEREEHSRKSTDGRVTRWLKPDEQADAGRLE
jgi:excisionase family DNA binding protein